MLANVSLVSVFSSKAIRLYQIVSYTGSFNTFVSSLGNNVVLSELVTSFCLTFVLCHFQRRIRGLTLSVFTTAFLENCGLTTRIG